MKKKKKKKKTLIHINLIKDKHKKFVTFYIKRNLNNNFFFIVLILKRGIYYLSFINNYTLLCFIIVFHNKLYYF